MRVGDHYTTIQLGMMINVIELQNMTIVSQMNSKPFENKAVVAVRYTERQHWEKNA